MKTTAAVSNKTSLFQDTAGPTMDCPHLPPGCITHSGPAGPAKRGGVIIPNIPGDRVDARVGRSWKDVWVLRVLVMGVAYRAE